ncbi:MAG: hypothetical protein K2W95_07060 [Candidatus Obscuribacterales bacterium]|nr:hypothetical protein [Candidatus Obscuribacterales bacterium]
METKQVKLAQPLIPLCVALLLVSQNASVAQTTQQNSTAQPQQQGVTVPEGGTYVIDFGNAPVFNANGNFTNAGTVYALSTNPAVTTGTLVSIDFFNQPGAVFTSVLPTGGIPGYTSAVSNLNLVLTAINNFTNAGIISSLPSLPESIIPYPESHSV